MNSVGVGHAHQKRHIDGVAHNKPPSCASRQVDKGNGNSPEYPEKTAKRIVTQPGEGTRHASDSQNRP